MGLFNMSKPTHPQKASAPAPKDPLPAQPPANHAAPTTANAADHPPKAEHIQTELAQSKAMVEDLTIQVKRVQAEFENYIKRNSRETQDFKKYCKKDLLDDIVDLFENLERALQPENSGEELRKGIELVYREFKKILNSEGVHPIEALGKPFNPDYHDALMTVVDDKKEEGTIVAEMGKGYLLHDKLLRASKVQITKHGPEVTNAQEFFEAATKHTPFNEPKRDDSKTGHKEHPKQHDQKQK